MVVLNRIYTRTGDAGETRLASGASVSKSDPRVEAYGTVDELNAVQMEVVNLINVLVDGKFVQDLKDPALIWRGSSNQVVHHLR